MSTAEPKTTLRNRGLHDCFTREPWPHQLDDLQDLVDTYIRNAAKDHADKEHLVISCPTGGGKSAEFWALCHWAVEHEIKVTLYTVRNSLLHQIIGQCRAEELTFGVEASQFRTLHNASALIQLCSMQTVARRKHKASHVFDAGIVIIDEAHQQKGKTARAITKRHKECGATVFGFSATPVAVNTIYTRCRQSCLSSDLRATTPPAHLPCIVYACPEAYAKLMRPAKAGEDFSQRELNEAWTADVYGHVLWHYRRLNPRQKPALLFAPGVAQSKYMTDVFNHAGIPWGHIDGDDVYIDGQTFGSSPDKRAEVITRLRDGDLKGISNRHVIREGIDIPELYHLILCAPIGNLASYCQTVGRVLRYHPSLKHTIIQDHAGNWWRHGSPSADRDFSDAYAMSQSLLARIRARDMEEAPAKLPEVCVECGAVKMRGRKCWCQRVAITCPRCQYIREWGRSCHNCGYRPIGKSRQIVQTGGMLRSQPDLPVTKKIRRTEVDTSTIWQTYYFRAKNSNMTFAQAEALFQIERGYYPAKDLPLMPKTTVDWFARVKDVHPSQLY